MYVEVRRFGDDLLLKVHADGGNQLFKVKFVYYYKNNLN